MKVQPGAFVRTVLPLDLSKLEELDSGRYHSIWLPDHMVSFWPDSLWTPEFTDLATVSPSPHRQVDALALAGAVAVLTKNVPIATSVVDTVRRHPSMLAQTALTLSHLSKGRFILGLGCGETENTVPYGFDFSKPVSRYEEALKVIRLLWETDGPVDFEGQFYHLHHARMDTEPYNGKFPEIWTAGSGPRMLDIAGRYADGWFPGVIHSPEEFAEKLKTIRDSAERAGRDPSKIRSAFFYQCMMGDDAELDEIFKSPLVRAYMLLQTSAADMRLKGYEHPISDKWRGMQDIDPGKLPRELLLDVLKRTPEDAIRAITPHGSPKKIAHVLKDYVDAGMTTYRAHDMSVLAGLKHAAKAPLRIRETEDELQRLVG